MSEEPSVIDRAAQPYAAICRAVTMQQLAEVLPPLNDAVARWLHEQGSAPVGPPFWRYLVIDMERELQMEVGFPTSSVLPPDGEVNTGELPAGRYVAVRHTGHPDTLMGATGALLDWAGQQGLTFDHRETEEGDSWACRLENYETDPADEPNLDLWVTELAFKLAD